MSNNESVSFPDAYRIIWGAADVAFDQNRLSPEVRFHVGEEIADMFARLDLIKQEAALYIESTSPDTVPTITIATLVSGVTRKIQNIYREQSAGRDQPVNPFSIKDDRMTALLGLDLYIRIAKNKLLKSDS